VQDLATFAHCLILTLDHHHENEETILFPALEREIGMMGYLDVASEQHKTFHDGLHTLWDMVKTSQENPDQWRWDEWKKVLDSFMPALEVHLTEEVDLMLSLEKYEEAGLKTAWEASINEGQKVGIMGLVGEVQKPSRPCLVR
jgi:hemerythrin-like domain-containing protein